MVGKCLGIYICAFDLLFVLLTCCGCIVLSDKISFLNWFVLIVLCCVICI